MLGRINEVLASQAAPHKVASYSLDGHARILEGDIPSNVLDATHGVVQLDPKLADTGLVTLADIANLTSRKSRSLFGDTYGSQLDAALRFSEHVGGVLEAAEARLTVPFPDTQSGKKLRQVAKLIRSHEQLQTERDTFFV